MRKTADDDGSQVMAIPNMTLWIRRAKKIEIWKEQQMQTTMDARW